MTQTSSQVTFKNVCPSVCDFHVSPYTHRYRPDSSDHPLQPHLPPQRPGQQPHHHGPGAEPTHEDGHQPVPAVSVRQRPDGVHRVHPLHPHPQPHAGLHLRHRHLQAGHVLHG